MMYGLELTQQNSKYHDLKLMEPYSKVDLTQV